MASSWRLTVRSLLRSPGFTSVALLTLALGAGANTAMFTVINALMLRPLPFADPQRLALLYETSAHSRQEFTDNLRIDRWIQLNHSFKSLAGYRYWRVSATGQGTPERLNATLVIGDLFQVLQIKPILGREFRPDEVRHNARVAIISYGYWKRKYQSDAQILGRPITLDGYPTIVGVMPAGLAPVLPNLPRNADVWSTAALDFTAAGLNGKGRPTTVCQAVGRLRPGVTIAQAQAEFDGIAQALGSEGRRRGPTGVRVAPAREEVAGDLRPALFALFAAVGCVLLIACVNIAGLTVARQSSRQRETAVRAALGASRSRVMLDSLAESVIVSLTGSLLGLLAAHCLLSALTVLSPVHFDQFGDLRIDGTVLWFVLGLALLNVLLFGLLPAFFASRVDLNSAIRESAGGRDRSRMFSTRSVLVAAEVALAAGLLVTAGLLLKSLLLLRSVDTGFDTRHLITATLPLPEASYGAPARRQALVNALSDRLGHLPGVESAGFTNSMALAGMFMMSADFNIDGAHPDKPPEANFVAVTPGYFHSAGMPLLAGRYFTETDEQHGEGALLNEAAAQRFFGSPRAALGHRISDEFCKTCPILGVVGNLRNFGLKQAAEPEFYVPLANMPCPALDIAVRTYASPAPLIAPVRAAITEVAPTLALDHIQTMQDVVADYVAQPRFNAVLVAVFAALALLLSAIGVFGVTAYWVAQRTREIGLRMALGAEAGRVLRMVLRQSLLAGGSGVVAGVGLALIVTKLLRSLLFGVAPSDPATFVGVGMAMLALVLLAAWIPARRAARVDPMTALRHD